MKISRIVGGRRKIYDYPKYDAVERLRATLRQGDMVHKQAGYWQSSWGFRFKARTVRQALHAGFVIREGDRLRLNP